tara:strand:+ start:393 stop:788 length:396 start_codon:yes stop_codon:yes gene_type:complete
MIVRKIFDQDILKINEWWRCHGWPPVNKYMLSSDGYLAEENGLGVAAAWYGKISNSKTALMEWMVKNPESNKEQTYKGFGLIREAIENQSKSDGFRILMTIIDHKNLKKFFSDAGYISGDKGYDTYLKILK